MSGLTTSQPDALGVAGAEARLVRAPAVFSKPTDAHVTRETREQIRQRLLRFIVENHRLRQIDSQRGLPAPDLP